jgi:hypothetical protein
MFDNVLLIDRIENTASSIYQSFDVSLKRRFARWGEVSGHYVYAGSYAYAMFYADYSSGVPSVWWPGTTSSAVRTISTTEPFHH